MKRRTVKKQFWFSRDEAQDLQKKAKKLVFRGGTHKTA